MGGGRTRDPHTARHRCADAVHGGQPAVGVRTVRSNGPPCSHA